MRRTASGTRWRAFGAAILPIAALALCPSLAGAATFDQVVALGDSLTKAQTNGFPRAMARMGQPFTNLAVNGATSDTLLDDQLGPALALDPTFAFVWIGGNDIKNDYWGVYDEQAATLLGNVTTTVDALLSSGATVVMANYFDYGLPPWIYDLAVEEFGSLTPEVLAQLAPVLDEIDELTRTLNGELQAIADARGIPVVDIYTLFEDMASCSYTIGGQCFILAPEDGTGMHLWNDSMHPSIVARAVIANEIMAVLNEEYGVAVNPYSEAELAAIAGIPLPEPASAALLGQALLVLALAARGHRRIRRESAQ